MLKVFIVTIFITISLIKCMDCNEDVESTVANITYNSYRLPNTTFPLHYHLHITTKIHVDDFDFFGNATIDIFVKNSTNQIVLNAKNLKNFIIKVYKLKNHKSASLLKNIVYSNDVLNNYLIISTCENCTIFKRGYKYRLEILYDGVMHDNFGIFWLAYKDYRNQTKHYAATHFEPIAARMALPCYDEPAFKANFSLRITHGSIYNAISNMGVREIRKHEDEEEMITTIFYTTPRMSTYLLVFVISDLNCTTSNYRGLIQHLYTSSSVKFAGQNQFLADASRIVAALEDYLDIYYPLAKLDHVILNKIKAMAMENWGVITYGESLLKTEKYEYHQQVIKNFIALAHEISHQWFGNLVTLQWWSYVWLNEGIATYFSYFITDVLEPQYEIMNLFVIDNNHQILNIEDSNYKPMTYYVEKSIDIVTRFDIISYFKGAAVIRMFHHAFDLETFLIGIKRFLKKFQYRTANEMDLFDSIQAAYKKNARFKRFPWANSLKDIMLSWTHSNWTPIIKIFRNYENDTITIRQYRNLEENLANSQNSTPFKYIWIPMNFASTSHRDFNNTRAIYFMPPIEEVTLNIDELGVRLENNDWLLVNKQQTGLYYVTYDDENLMKIAKGLKHNHSHIHELNRADIFQGLRRQLDKDDIESIITVLELLEYLGEEQSYTVWYFAATLLSHLNRHLHVTSYHLLFKQFAQKLLTATYQRLFANKSMAFVSATESHGRQQIIAAACDVDLPDCLKFATNKTFEYIFQYENFKIANAKYNNSIDRLLCHGLRKISIDQFKAVLSVLWNSPPNIIYYDNVVYALRCVENIDNINAYLDLLANNNLTYEIMEVNNENFINILYMYERNYVARPIVWNFINLHHKHLSIFPEFLGIFKGLIEYLPTYQHSQARNLYHKLVSEANSSNDTNSIKRLLDFDLTVIGRKAEKIQRFVNKFGSSIYDWLRRHEENSLAPNSVSSNHATVFRLLANFFTKLLFC